MYLLTAAVKCGLSNKYRLGEWYRHKAIVYQGYLCSINILFHYNVTQKRIQL